jgi:hypothetical protein
MCPSVPGQLRWNNEKIRSAPPDICFPRQAVSLPKRGSGIAPMKNGFAPHDIDAFTGHIVTFSLAGIVAIRLQSRTQADNVEHQLAILTGKAPGIFEPPAAAGSAGLPPMPVTGLPPCSSFREGLISAQRALHIRRHGLSALPHHNPEPAEPAAQQDQSRTRAD